MAGRIDGKVNGRPISLTAEDQALVLSLERWRTLLNIRKVPQNMCDPLRAFLERSNLRLVLRTKWFGNFELLPNPSAWVRALNLR
jgi:hypothetical protein